MARQALPPGPRFAPLQAVRLLRDPVGYMRRLERRYGDAFTVPVPLFGRITYFADPAVAKELFRGDPAVFHLGEANMDALGPLVGPNSLVTLDDDAHLRERRLLLPPFHGDRIQRYARRFEEIAADEVERWPVGEPFELRPRMQRLSLEVLLRTVLGVGDERRLHDYEERVARMMRVANLPIWIPALRRDLGPLSPWGRFLRARAVFDQLVHDEIDRGRADPGLDDRDDVLALLLRTRREDGSALTREELRDEVTTVIVAGHETTATSLTWFFERVLRHPEVEERLRADVEAGDGEYLDATVREVFRVRPPFLDVVRRVTDDVELGGWAIPAGSFVGLSTILVHHRPDAHPDPDAFRPERFLAGGPSGFAWIPFGGGVRRCIGAAFAQLEMSAIARAILARARLRAPDPRPEAARTHHVMLVPEHGCRVVVDERLGAAEATGAMAAAA